MKNPVANRRIRDFVLYVAIAVAVVAFALLYAVRSAKSGSSGRLPLRWLGLGATTAVVFGYVLRPCKRYYHLVRFWVAFVGLFALHLGVYIVVLLHVEQWGLAWFAIITPVEIFVMGLILCTVGEGTIRAFWKPNLRHEK